MPVQDDLLVLSVPVFIISVLLEAGLIHRVHHAINPRYLDKNFAGVFSIWDRMFGTYEPEVEKPFYGVLKPLGSWNAVWANVEPWVYMAKLARGAPALRQKLWVPFADPAWQPGRGKASPADLQQLFEKVKSVRLEAHLSKPVTAYVFAQFMVVLTLSALYLNCTDRFAVGTQAVFIAWVVLSLFSLGAICDRNGWAWGAEGVRLAVGAAGAFWLTG